MKSFGAIFVFAVLLMSGCRSGGKDALQKNGGNPVVGMDSSAAGFDLNGVTLISPSSPAFDSQAESDVGSEWMDVVRLAKPYVVIISNSSTRPIVAFATEFKMTRRDGSKTTSVSLEKFPDSILGTDQFSSPENRAVAPGTRRLIGIDFEIPRGTRPTDPDWNFAMNDTREWIMNSASKYGDVQKVEISLDAVIFDDGVMIGPDESQLSFHLGNYLREKQEFCRSILARVSKGSSLEAAFDAVRASFATDRRQPGAVSEADDAMDALGQIEDLSEKLGDGPFLTFAKEVASKPPFEIHRK